MRKIGVYIHWSFCEMKCPYCDFNTYVTKNNIDQSQWLNSYKNQILYFISQINIKDYILESIFFGGGTPSLMDPDIIEEIITLCKNQFRCNNELEITIESNPSSVELRKFYSFKKAGVNRISIGIQSLNPMGLKWLGRSHTVEEGIEAIHTAREVFKNYSFDMIYGIKGQTVKEWELELQKAIELANNHMSLYNLIIENNTKFGQLQKLGKLDIPNSRIMEELYFVTNKIMQQSGFTRYEISNHYKNNELSRHNMLYWNYDDYIGVGPYAEGRLINKNNIKVMTKATKDPWKWLDQTGSINKRDNKSYQKMIEYKHTDNQIEGFGCTMEKISTKDQIKELIIMGFRIIDGINIAEAEDKIQTKLLTPDIMKKINTLEEHDFVKLNNEYIIPTEKGMDCANSITKFIVDSM